MYATVLVNIKRASDAQGKNIHLNVQAADAETCLSLLTSKLRPLLNYSPRLTFRPADGAIFLDTVSPKQPIGVLYRQPYLAPN